MSFPITPPTPAPPPPELTDTPAAGQPAAPRRRGRPTTRTMPAPARLDALVFEVDRPLGGVSSAGVRTAPGGLKITTRSGPALSLLAQIGVDRFTALHALLLLATDNGEHLVIDANGDELGSVLGWGRQKASRVVTELVAAGLLDREKQTVLRMPDGTTRYSRGRYVLCPSLYRDNTPASTLGAADEQLGRAGDATNDTGPAAPDVAESDSGTTRAGAAEIDTGTPGASEIDTGYETAGRADDSSPVVAGSGTFHEEQMNELHSSRPTTGPAADADRIPELVLRAQGPLPTTPAAAAAMTDDQLLDVLTSWQFHGAVKVMARVEPAELRRLVGFVGERLTTIPNPGAYLRRCLDSSAPAAAAPSSSQLQEAAAVPATAPAPGPGPARAASAAQRLTDPDPQAGTGLAAGARHVAGPQLTGRILPSLTDDQLLTLRAALSDEQRTAFTDGPGRMWKLDASWSNLPSGRMSRSRLVAELERAGLLAHLADLGQDAS